MTTREREGSEGDKGRQGADRLLGLLAPHHDQAVRAARRLCRSNADGDDLFQETVLRALAKLGELRDDGRFRAWFFAVMLSVHRARSRRSFWRRFVSFDDDAEEPPDRAPSPFDERDERDGAERMARALATLAPEGREAIVLFELEGFSLEEVASLQGASVPAVKSRLVRSRERLAQHYTRLFRATPHLAVSPSQASTPRPQGEPS